MNERQHAVLSLFYDEGHREVTPSLLAYRMRMSTDDATKLLDGMVKTDILDLKIDDEGHLSYQLPPSERHRIGERRQQQQRRPRNEKRTETQRPTSARPRSDATQSTERNDSQNPPPGTDASPGYGRQRQTTQSTTRRHGGADGTDGSVASTNRPHPQATPYRPEQHSDPPQSSPDQPYGDWYADGHRQGQNQPHPGHNPSAAGPQGSPQQRGGPHQGSPQQRGGLYERQGPQQRQQQQPQQHHQARNQTATANADQFSFSIHQNQGAIPDRQALAPYQSNTPAADQRVGPRRQRIPVLAGALSLLIPGLGQFYNGEIGKGVMLLFSYMFLWVFWLFWIVHIWSIIDAYMIAEQSNQPALPDGSDSSPSHQQQPHLGESPHNHSSNAA